MKRRLLQHFNNCRRNNNTASNIDANTEYQSAVVQKDLAQQDQER